MPGAVSRALTALLVAGALSAWSAPVAAQVPDAPAGPSPVASEGPVEGAQVELVVPDVLGAQDGMPMGFVSPDGQAGGVGAVGGIGIPLGLLADGASMVSSAPVTDDYVQVTQMLEQQNLAARALEAAERARQESERRRIEAARNRGERVPESVPYARLFNDAGALRALDPRLLAAVAKVGSGLRADGGSCKGGAGPRGLMALEPGVAASYGVDPCNPDQAVGAAAALLRGLYERYSSWELALGAYRSGAAEVDRTRKVPPGAAGFVSSVMAAWEQYKRPSQSSAQSGPESQRQGPNGTVCVRQAAGITVACHIAPNVEALVAAAAADGVRLTGSGYRDHQNQIRLRRAHCGPTQYDIYQKPSSQCSPPTARPGASMHERGEAIDFQNCSTRSTACHQWLKRRGAQFGLFNLPSEPWHWSTNGA